MRLFVFLSMILGLFIAAVPAQPKDYEPGSVLLFPTFDSRSGSGKGTVISVTNTNGSYSSGKIQVHYHYVEGLAPFNNVFDRVETLTPEDTLTVLAGSHNPEMEVGYLLVVAEDTKTDKAKAFDYLIGDEIIVDLANNKLWAIPAIPFKSIVTSGDTDLNGNGSVDFDGKEYDYYPDKLFISSFFEQSKTMEGELILVSGLGSYYNVKVEFLFYDNEEDVFSRNYEFICWTSEKLVDISKVTKALGGTTSEPATGWARLDGSFAIHVLTGKLWNNELTSGVNYDPPIEGAFVQRVLPGPGLEFGHLLHHTGSQNGNEFPWWLADD